MALGALCTLAQRAKAPLRMTGAPISVTCTTFSATRLRPTRSLAFRASRLRPICSTQSPLKSVADTSDPLTWGTSVKHETPPVLSILSTHSLLRNALTRLLKKLKFKIQPLELGFMRDRDRSTRWPHPQDL